MRHSFLLLHSSAKHRHYDSLLGLPIMSLICAPLALSNPLYRERCIASSADGGVCLRWIDANSAERDIPQTELFLSNQVPKLAKRAIIFRNAAKRMICGSHKNRLEETRRVARLWEEEAAQQCNAAMHSSSAPSMQPDSTSAYSLRCWNRGPLHRPAVA